MRKLIFQDLSLLSLPPLLLHPPPLDRSGGARRLLAKGGLGRGDVKFVQRRSSLSVARGKS